MADPEKQTLAKLTTLVAALREAHAKCHELTDEIDRVLAGGPGMGELLARLEARFKGLWSERYKSSYVWLRFKDKPHLERLLKTLTAEEIEARMGRFIHSDDPFFVNGRHKFAMFVASINGLVAPRLPLGQLAAVNCAHTPPCGSDQEHTARRRVDLRSGVA